MPDLLEQDSEGSIAKLLAIEQKLKLEGNTEISTKIYEPPQINFEVGKKPNILKNVMMRQ